MKLLTINVLDPTHLLNLSIICGIIKMKYMGLRNNIMLAKGDKMEAIVNQKTIIHKDELEPQRCRKENGYVRPDILEKQKQDYIENLDRENETVWGEPIEFVTLNKPVYNRLTRSFDREKTIHAIKLGRLYFYVKDELTPNYAYTAEEIKEFLLEGDIGAWIEELMVKEGYYMDFAGGVDNPSNYREKIFASIGTSYDHNPTGDWQIIA